MTVTRQYPAGISQRSGETIDRNLELIHGYIRAQLEDVDNMEHVPEGAETVLLPDDDPEMFERNLEIVINSLRGGANVYARHVTKDGRPK
jgi:hypothetical protein